MFFLMNLRSLKYINAYSRLSIFNLYSKYLSNCFSISFSKIVEYSGKVLEKEGVSKDSSSHTLEAKRRHVTKSLYKI